MTELKNLHPENRTRTTPIVRHWRSVSEIIDNADKINSEHGTSYPAAKGGDWTYGTDWTDEQQTRAGLLSGEAPAAALAAYEALSREHDAASLTTTSAPTRRRRQVWADQGDEIDADRMNARHDRPWRATVTGRACPIVRLALNIGLGSSNKGAEFAQTAATAAAIADALTLAGFAVEIIGCEMGINDREAKGATVNTFPLKAANEPLDARRILSAAAPGLLRAYLIPQLVIDTGSDGAGVAILPHNAAELIGTPHIIARHWEGGVEVTPAQQAARIIQASKAAAT